MIPGLINRPLLVMLRSGGMTIPGGHLNLRVGIAFRQDCKSFVKLLVKLLVNPWLQQALTSSLAEFLVSPDRNMTRQWVVYQPRDHQFCRI